MIRKPLHALLVLLALAGIQINAVPAYAVAVDEGGAGARTIVICTGLGLKTIVVGADGQPLPGDVPLPDSAPADHGDASAHDCLTCCLRLAGAAVLPASAQPMPAAARRVFRRWPAARLLRQTQPRFRRKPRSPPLV